MSVHPQASVFEDVAGEYERARPGYPRTILDWLGSRGQLHAGSTVIDLGAGTGKLTRVLIESGASVIAIEPLAAMREEFQRILPDVELLDATAESIPLADGLADLVTCGQSIHWFAHDAALEEIARVLRNGGELVIATNGYDHANPIHQRLTEIRREAEAEASEKTPGGNWREVIGANAHFELIGEVVLRNEHFVDREGVFARVKSSSPFARLPAARQHELLAGLESLIDTDIVDLSQLTTVVAYRKVEPS
jgi:SAM-dependent methyltransferase